MTKYKHGSAKRITKGMVFWCSDGSKVVINPEGGPSKLGHPLSSRNPCEENNDPPKKTHPAVEDLCVNSRNLGIERAAVSKV
jgi:hypothetical protein